MNEVRKYKIGLLGCGNVGRGLVELVNRKACSNNKISFQPPKIAAASLLQRHFDQHRPFAPKSLL